MSFVIDGAKNSFGEIANFFGRNDKALYTFGSPCIWNFHVLESLEKRLNEDGCDFEKMINISPYEMNWYGEFLLSNPDFRFRSIGPLAKVYHYQIFYEEERILGQSKENLSENYIMVIMQNKWVKDDVFKSSFFGILMNYLRNISFSKNKKRIKKMKNKRFFKR